MFSVTRDGYITPHTDHPFYASRVGRPTPTEFDRIMSRHKRCCIVGSDGVERARETITVDELLSADRIDSQMQVFSECYQHCLLSRSRCGLRVKGEDEVIKMISDCGERAVYLTYYPGYLLWDVSLLHRLEQTSQTKLDIYLYGYDSEFVDAVMGKERIDYDYWSELAEKAHLAQLRIDVCKQWPMEFNNILAQHQDETAVDRYNWYRGHTNRIAQLVYLFPQHRFFFLPSLDAISRRIDVFAAIDPTDDDFPDPKRVYELVEKINPSRSYTLCAVNNQTVEIGFDGVVGLVNTNAVYAIQ